MFWHSAIPPCLQTLHEEEGTRETFVMDDTFICEAGVIFDTIDQEKRTIKALEFLAMEDINA